MMKKIYTMDQILDELKVAWFEDDYYLHVPIQTVALAPRCRVYGLPAIEGEVFTREWGIQFLDGYKSRPINIPATVVFSIWNACGAEYLDTVAHSICTIINYEALTDFRLLNATVNNPNLPTNLVVTI